MPEPRRKSVLGGRFNDTALAQHGVFRLEHLAEAGLSPRAVQKRTRRGELHRLYHGVYGLVPRELLTPRGHVLAAVYACGPGAVASHRTAAMLHELRASNATRFDVTIPKSTSVKRAGINVHRSITLTAADVTEVENVPCTSVARTLFDLAELISRRALERAFDQAAAEEVLDLRAVQDQMTRNPTRPAAKLVRAVLLEHYAGSTLTASELEERFVSLARAWGLPAPEVNKWLDLDDGRPPIKADFLWREQRVILETDGWKTHRTRQAFESNRNRDQRALARGYITVRTTERGLERTPGDALEAVRAAMNR